MTETDLQNIKEKFGNDLENILEDMQVTLNNIRCGNCGEPAINTSEGNEENRGYNNQPIKFSRQELMGIGIGFSIGQGIQDKKGLEENINWFLDKLNHEKINHNQDDRFFFQVMVLAVELAKMEKERYDLK